MKVNSNYVKDCYATIETAVRQAATTLGISNAEARAVLIRQMMVHTGKEKGLAEFKAKLKKMRDGDGEKKLTIGVLEKLLD